MRHEKLECYRSLLRIAQEVGQAARRWPRGFGDLISQLQRALCSSICNLSEGNGKRSAADRRKFFDIARGSISESSACLDVAFSLGYITSSAHTQWKSVLLKSYHQIGRLPIS